MSKLNDMIKKVAPDLINLAVDGLRHYRDTKGVMDAEIPDVEPAVNLEGDIERLENDPYVAIAKQMEDGSDLDLGYDQAATVSDVQESRLSHVGRDASRPPQVVEKPEYGAEAKSYEGQSDESYCLECIVKHSQSAAMAMTEAIQRAEAGDPALEGVKEKVKAAVRQLTGIEEDAGNVSEPAVRALDTMGRSIRKYVYTTGAEIGKASKEQLYETQNLIEELVNASYLAREVQEGDCPGCGDAVGILMGLNVGKSLDMPDIDELEALVKDERVEPVAAMEAIIGHAKSINEDDAVDYLTGVKKMMITPR